MAASSPQLMLSLLFVAVLCVGSGTAGADTALDDICKSLGGHYITPDFCMSALCYEPTIRRCRAATRAGWRCSRPGSSSFHFYRSSRAHNLLRLN